MSPRPPAKISLKHDWKRDLGSKNAQQSEVGQLSRSFQSNQPIPNSSSDRLGQPVCRTDRSGQPVGGAGTRTVQDGRKTSRSQEIGVNSFHEELGSSERTGTPVSGKPVDETSVIQALSSEDRKDFNVEQAHERTEWPVITHDVITVSDSAQTRTAHESETFNVGDETLRERTVRLIIDHDVNHESIMVNEANMDFRIPRVPHSVVEHAQSTSVRELIHKFENHQIDTLFNKIYDKINHLTISVQNQSKWFRMWVTSNCGMLLRMKIWLRAIIVYLATITTRSRRRTTRAHLFWQAQTMGVGRVHLQHGGIGKAPGGLLIIQKVRKEEDRVLNERGPVSCNIWRESSKLAFTCSICFVTVESLTADGGLL